MLCVCTIHRCSRETDGAGSYNSVFVALFTLQLGQGGQGIKVVRHSHNEPGHGADICDTAGANCIRECWRWTKRTGVSIVCAAKTCECLRESQMQGFIHLQVVCVHVIYIYNHSDTYVSVCECIVCECDRLCGCMCACDV